MRRLVAFVALVISLSACTPAQGAFWKSWFASDPQEAKAAWDQYEHLSEATPNADAPIPANAPMGSKCPQWYDEAMDAGFTYNQWRTVDRIMWRESKCLQHVRNPSGATGLMQIMPMWADDCGTTISGLQVGHINLRCAVHVHQVQGWEAWSTY